MSNPNFVNDLVMMAKAFEELPQVKAELEAKKADYDAAQDIIQELQLRLIDRKNELDAAHAATRKAEVERDHAETMFLETDDKLQSLRRIFTHFQSDVDAFAKANDPQPEPTPEPVKYGASEPQVSEAWVEHSFDPGPAIGTAFHGDPGNIDSVSSGPQGLREVDPTTAPIPTSVSENPNGDTIASSVESTSTERHDMFPEKEYYTKVEDEGVSVPSDPTPAMASSSENALPASTPLPAAPQPDPWPYFGKRYTDVPFYVSLAEWLNGGGTEEAYHGR